MPRMLNHPEAPEALPNRLDHPEAPEALETDLRQAVQLRALARLSPAVAHDLKGSLNAMVLNVELLRATLERQSEVVPEAQEKLRRYVAALGREITRLDEALRTILAQTQPGQEASEPFDLRQLVEELRTLLAPQARRQKVSLEVAVPEQPVPVEVPRDRLKQAAINIAVNALEAMPDGGELALVLSAANGSAHLAVIDDGPGIPPDVLPHIWTLHTAKATGTGAGLFVARSILEACDGSIDVVTGGNGTSFTLQIPLREED